MSRRRERPGAALGLRFVPRRPNIPIKLIGTRLQGSFVARQASAPTAYRNVRLITLRRWLVAQWLRGRCPSMERAGRATGLRKRRAGGDRPRARDRDRAIPQARGHNPQALGARGAWLRARA